MPLTVPDESLLSHAGWVIRQKCVLCGGLLVMFSIARLAGFLEFPLALFAIAPLVEMTLNLPHHWLLRAARNPRRVFIITSTLDVLLITWAAYTLGDLGKFLALIIYPLVFIFAGAALRPRDTFFYANLSFAAIAGLTYLEFHGLLPMMTPMMLPLSGLHRLAILLIVFPLYNFMAYFVSYLSSLLRAREQQLVRSVFYDELTELASRDLFLERLRQALARADSAGAEGQPAPLFAVLFLDLDRFKLINSSYGHHVGDQLLREVSRRLEACVKTIDTVAHVGGDEFAILLENIKDPQAAPKVAQRIQQALAAPFTLEGHEVFTSASIGITRSSPRGDQAAEDLLRDAHTAMYRAKSQGTARYAAYETAMRPRAMASVELETELRHAVEEAQFCLYYQPIVALPNGALVGFEALIRWIHPVRGLISPGEFIPLAEEIGLIVPIGKWAIRQACQQLQRWRQLYPGRRTIPAVSVNLSGHQFKQAHLAEEVTRILAETGAEAKRLKFEITESVLIERTRATISELARLRHLSVQLYMDDFGTGYSSLSYLRRFKVDKLKIDRSFISRIERREADLELVRNIIRLAHGLGMGVIAEGVETAGQLEHLKRGGCDYAQGFYFSKPVNVEAAKALIEESVGIDPGL